MGCQGWRGTGFRFRFLLLIIFILHTHTHREGIMAGFKYWVRRCWSSVDFWRFYAFIMTIGYLCVSWWNNESIFNHYVGVIFNHFDTAGIYGGAWGCGFATLAVRFHGLLSCYDCPWDVYSLFRCGWRVMSACYNSARHSPRWRGYFVRWFSKGELSLMLEWLDFFWVNSLTTNYCIRSWMSQIVTWWCLPNYCDISTERIISVCLAQETDEFKPEFEQRACTFYKCGKVSGRCLYVLIDGAYCTCIDAQCDKR